MRAEITKNGEITIVSLEGQISFDTITPFRDHCMTKLKGSKVVFDLGQLNFVGSIGITSFFEIIKDLVELKTMEPKFCNVKSEFQKLFTAWFSNNVEIYEQKEQAIYAFLNPAASLATTQKTPIRVPQFKLNQEEFFVGRSANDYQEDED
jgi:anti-anti-sigma regulatory factor